MHLALRLGMTLKRLRREMDCPEYTLWMAHAELEGDTGYQDAEDQAATEASNAAKMRVFFKTIAKEQAHERTG